MGRNGSPGVLVDAAVGHLEQLTARDREFESDFGSYRRPAFARRYPLEGLLALVRYAPNLPEVIDVAPFVLALAEEDRWMAGEVARWVYAEFEHAPATDKTLGMFRLNLARRLEALGY